MASIQRIAPCLWFDRQAEEAARFYCSVFPNSAINHVAHYGKDVAEIHKGREGSVLVVGFTLDGQPFVALNGGPQFKFTEAVSLMVYCDNQKEIDYYWDRLGEGGGGTPNVCGWLKDKYGLSWQIAPRDIARLHADPERAERVMKVVMQSKKLDMAALQRAYDGK